MNRKHWILIALALLQVACATNEVGGQVPLLDYEALGAEITVSHETLPPEPDLERVVSMQD